MTRIDRVRDKLMAEFSPLYLDILDESHMHGRGGAETHLRVVIVSEKFRDQPLVQRQRLVNALLKPEFSLGLHALALRTLTEEEWQKEGGVDRQSSPLCASGRSGGRGSDGVS